MKVKKFAMTIVATPVRSRIPAHKKGGDEMDPEIVARTYTLPDHPRSFCRKPHTVLQGCLGETPSLGLYADEV